MTEKLLVIVGVTALCMISPGPDMILVMRNTLTQDRHHGGLTALGVLTGNLIHIGYCTVGIALLLSRSPVAYDVLRIAGAIYLAWLGIQGLRSADAGNALPAPRDDVANPYSQGLINNLLNPKGSLFYLGVFTQIITPEVSLSQTALLVAVMLSVSAMFWVMFIYALHLPMIRTGLSDWRVPINRVFGVLLIAVAARVAIFK